MKLSPLNRNHDRLGFSCGNDALDCYFRERAPLDVKYRNASCFVLTREEASSEVLGFFTLSQASYDYAAFEGLKITTTYKKVPMTLLGRLAVSSRCQRQGIGSRLLSCAVQLTKDCAVATRGIAVEAKNEQVMQFYLKQKFQRLDALPLTAVFLFSRKNKIDMVCDVPLSNLWALI